PRTGRVVLARIDAAVERTHPPSAMMHAQALENGPAREGQVHVEARNERRLQILATPALEARDGDGRVDVVEGRKTRHPWEHPLDESRTVGNVRADDHEVRLDFLLEPEPLLEIIETRIQE